MLGFRFTREERDAVMHLWRYVSVVMGVDDALLAHDYRAGLRQMVIQLLTNPPADQDSRALAKRSTSCRCAWRRVPSKRSSRASTCAI